MVRCRLGRISLNGDSGSDGQQLLRQTCDNSGSGRRELYNPGFGVPASVLHIYINAHVRVNPICAIDNAFQENHRRDVILRGSSVMC